MKQDDVVGPWSEDKLQLLKKYLDAYTRIMQGQTWCRNGYHYIDAFAGTGKPRARDEERYINGSPRVALTIQHPFHSYTFIEKTPWRVRRLRNLVTEFPDAPSALTQAQIERMNRFWGSTTWRDDIYEQQPTLFGDSVEMKIRRTTGRRLGRLFKERLAEVFPHVTDPLVMTNSRHAPLYCLIFAGHNPTGARIVGDIFQRYERLGQ